MDLLDDHANLGLLYNEQYEPILEKLAHRGVTSFELLVSDAKIIAEKCNLRVNEVQRLVNALTRELTRRTRLEEAKQESIFSTGEDEFDKLLEGGIRKGTVTEVFGQAGAGKSNLLTQLCACIQIPTVFGGCDQNAVYIATESGLETRRLISFVERFNTLGYDRVSTDRVFTFTCQSRDELQHVLKYQVPVLVKQKNVGLLVIDSMANFYRGAANARDLAVTAHLLRNLAHDYNLAAVVSNQITSTEFGAESALHPSSMAYQMQFSAGSGARVFDTKARTMLQSQTIDPTATPGQWPQSQQSAAATATPPPSQSLSSREKGKTIWMNVPALGHEWLNYVDVRIELEKRHLKRIFHLVLSPYASTGTSLEFEILPDRVGVPNLTLTSK